MSSRNPINEVELEDLLRRDPDEGVVRLDQDYRQKIARVIKWQARGRLQPDDLSDVYQNVMCAVIKRFRQPSFNPDRPLRIVFTIARNKTIDELRRLNRSVKTNADSVIENIPDDLRDPRDLAEAKEVGKTLEDTIRTLPPRQQLVGKAYAEHHESLGPKNKYRLLTRILGKITGKKENEEAVKSVWQQVNAKLKRALRKLGYDFRP